jgi:hypothetical protein
MQGWDQAMRVAAATIIEHDRTHTSAPIERITLTPTVGRDLQKRRSAQRLPAFC